MVFGASIGVVHLLYVGCIANYIEGTLGVFRSLYTDVVSFYDCGFVVAALGCVSIRLADFSPFSIGLGVGDALCLGCDVELCDVFDGLEIHFARVCTSGDSVGTYVYVVGRIGDF